MDRLLQIETFIAAVEHASFSDAARELKVTPAIIGRRVDALVKRLHVKIAEPIDTHLTVTEDGRQYVERCQWTLLGSGCGGALRSARSKRCFSE